MRSPPVPITDANQRPFSGKIIANQGEFFGGAQGSDILLESHTAAPLQQN